jgi:Fic family protein
MIRFRDKPERFAELMRLVQKPLVKGEYLHWDKLLHLTVPGDFTHDEWWLGLKFQRVGSTKPVPLTDTSGKPFTFTSPDLALEALQFVDRHAAGRIEVPEPIVNPEMKDRYYVESLIQEAVTSSQLEGATTTRQVAKEMIRTGRKPRDRSEKMILNNYLTMRRIGDLKNRKLSPELVFDLHRSVTESTLDNDFQAGRFRREDEPIDVVDGQQQVVHVPPPAQQLPDRMAAMCSFANGETPDSFIHPVIRSIVLHFWLAYDHPFVDGNGRTARALFYWSMLRSGYWLFEFISISQILLKAPAKYGRAFLYSETDDNDLTYFILYQLETIRRAIDELNDFVKSKTKQIDELEFRLKGMRQLNHRQRSLIAHAVRHPHFRYTIESHRSSHDVVHQTARADLLELKKLGLIEGGKVGRRWYFTPVDSLEEKLENGL